MGVFGILGPFEGIFSFVGTLIVTIFVLTTLYFIAKHVYVYFLAELLGQTVDFKSLGEWAVVTGATDGIGKGYALDLARRGCNIVLISRTEAKLRSVAKEIETAYNVRTKIIAVDFGADESIYDTIKDGLQGLEIGVLINNVGVGVPGPDCFHLMPGGESFYLNMIRVNCVSQALMTRIIIPQMLARRKGVIVHLSSAAGATPIPFAAGYSASKAYNHFLARAIQQEYEDKGIINQVVMPYMVATNMSGFKADGLLALDVTKYTRSCLNTVGFFNQTNGHPIHAVQNWCVMMVPHVLSGRMLRKLVELWAQALKSSQEQKQQ